MRHCFTLFLFAFFLIPASHAQPDCRVKKESFQPIIAVYNPFFTDHHWDNLEKYEKARLGPYRRLLISQSGCKRHHVNIIYLIKKDVIQNRPSFWKQETYSLMQALFFENPEYEKYRQEFEEAFSEKIDQYGLNQSFNFPMGSRNFVCEVRYDPERGANILIEMVHYIFAENIRKKGIPRSEDDGWYQRAANER
jgi:hypothetical protein